MPTNYIIDQIETDKRPEESMKAKLYWGLYCSVKEPKRESGTQLWTLGSLNEVKGGRWMVGAEWGFGWAPAPSPSQSAVSGSCAILCFCAGLVMVVEELGGYGHPGRLSSTKAIKSLVTY